MLLDFSTPESCVKTLDYITTIPLYKIAQFSREQELAGNYSTAWIEDFINKDLFKDYSKIYTTFFHITSAPDSKEFEKYGLQNLQTVLSTNNHLSRFLHKYDIHFDVPERILYYADKAMDLKKIKSSNTFYRLFNRIDFDFNVNGFYYFASSKYSNYSTIDEIPEFLSDILYRVFPDSDTYHEVVADWKKQTNRFVVKAELPISKIDIESEEEFPYQITSRLLDFLLYPTKEMIPNNSDIIYISRKEFITPNEIKSIITLPR